MAEVPPPEVPPPLVISSETQIIVVSALALCILPFGHVTLDAIMHASSKPQGDAGPRNRVVDTLGSYALQIFGLTYILPVILVISVVRGLSSEAVTAVLGAIVGYVFGSASQAKEIPPDSPPLIPSNTPDPTRANIRSGEKNKQGPGGAEIPEPHRAGDGSNSTGEQAVAPQKNSDADKKNLAMG